ncbi:hypothetical protein BGX33_004999, partial [Mortierella sp. NVP41]
LIRGNGNSADGEMVNYYLVTPRVLHHDNRRQHHARSSSSPSAASIFAPLSGTLGGRRSRTRTEIHSHGVSQGGPIVPLFLAIPPHPSEPQPPAYEELSPREDRTSIPPTTRTSTNATMLATTPPRIDSLPGANTYNAHATPTTTTPAHT